MPRRHLQPRLRQHRVLGGDVEVAMTEDSIDGVGLARGRAVRVLVEKEVQWPLLIGKALLAVLRHRLRRNHLHNTCHPKGTIQQYRVSTSHGQHLVHEAVDAVVGSLAPSVVPGHAVGAHARRLQIGLTSPMSSHGLLQRPLWCPWDTLFRIKLGAVKGGDWGSEVHVARPSVCNYTASFQPVGTRAARTPKTPTFREHLTASSRAGRS
mmetsp:Transcript_76333/g.205264  ORF Transcript_76333/g.205264 Transcript_76333/m.205264 type:complete len:209 (+) Transcript_76333:4448-5074(+)